MGIIGFLRNRMGLIIAVVIGISLFAFIAGEVAHYGSSYFHGDNNELGDVAGEKIALDTFNNKVETNTNNFMQQSRQGTLTPQIKNYIQETTWDEAVTEKILSKEMSRLGLVVGDDEIQSLIQGDNPSQQIIQAFGNPQTGQLDRTKLNTFLSNLQTAKADDPIHARWDEFVRQIIDNRRREKYMNLVGNALYVNSLEAKDDYENKNKLVNFKYVELSYSSIPDNKVAVTDEDYQNYYNDHKGEFQNQQETRSLEYVVFNAAPSKDDSAAVKTQMDKVVTDFKASTNDSLFVEVNSETKTPMVYQRKGQLQPKMLDSVMFGASPGFVYGPYFDNGSYKVAKLVDARIGPDSVKARHILIAPNAGLEKALAKADSIKKVIESGKATFADMAKQYSVDGSASKGGELGTFGRGTMVGPFDDAVFNGKKGDIKIVTTQFGVHIIEIEDQKGSSKVVKVAVVDKPITASTSTQSAAYSKAQGFLGKLTKENFDDEAKKAGLKTVVAADITGEASGFMGVEDARDVVRWAYKSDVGDFSDQVFTLGTQYIVARLTEIKPKGILPLESVKTQIKPQVINAVKGKMLSDKLQAAVSGSSNLSQVAQKVGSTVTPLQNLVAANPMIPGGSVEYKVVGTIFASQPGKLSGPVIGQAGVYVFAVDGFVKPAALTNAVREKQQIGQMLLQRSQQQVFDALKDKANVKDYRYKLL